MWVPHIADAELVTGVVHDNAEALGLPAAVGRCRLLDARISHPHRPESPRCRGSATYAVQRPAGFPPDLALLYLKAFPDGDSEGAWAELQAREPGARATHLPHLDLIAWRFPDDPGLPALPELVDPGRAAALLPAAARDGSDGRQMDLGRVDVEVVRYQPETSCTIRYDVTPSEGSAPVTVFAKMLAGDTTATLAAAHERLWTYSASTPALRIAEPLGADPRLGVLWTRGVPGSSLRTALEPARVTLLARDVARLLAALHASGVVVGSPVTVDGCVEEAGKKATKLARALPAAHAAVDAVAAEIRRLHPTVTASPPVPLHGDFHADQLLDAPTGPVLVDLDSMVTGDPELDVAELVVDLAMGDVPAVTVREFVAALLPAYERDAGRALDPGLLKLLAGAEFLNRCYRHLRRRAPGWEEALVSAVGRHADVTAALPATG